MSFAVFTDGSSNLPENMLGGITVLPCSYLLEDRTILYDGNVDRFDGHSFYEGLKQGKKAKTTLLNSFRFMTGFAPALEEGRDVLYVSMSSGISGTYHAARMAAAELMEKYPDRRIEIIDSMGCGFGIGLLAVRAAALSMGGTDIRKAACVLRAEVSHMCQYFTVDDLNFLKTTGRVSGSTAQIATILNIKPILFGDAEGHIVSCGKVRGRKAAIQQLARKYSEKVENAAGQTVCISHGDCIEDAGRLAELISELNRPESVVICQHEPFSGCHVGPGMLGLFFYGKER